MVATFDAVIRDSRPNGRAPLQRASLRGLALDDLVM